MRLIDADKLLPKLWVCYEENKPVVDAEPTVEAIPIEWLKKHKYPNIIDLWEKDCRLKDTKSILDKLLSEHNFRSYNDYVEYAEKIAALPRDDRLDILFKEKENEDV